MALAGAHTYHSRATASSLALPTIAIPNKSTLSVKRMSHVPYLSHYQIGELQTHHALRVRDGSSRADQSYPNVQLSIW